MEPLIRNVTALPSHELELEFSNGERRLFDVKPYLDKGIFAQLKDWHYFAKVQASPRFVSGPRVQDFSLDTLLARGKLLEPESRA